MDMELLWQQAINLGLIENMRAKLNKKWNRHSAIRDKFVPIHVRVNAHIAVQLNQRQLWFLGHLQQGDKMVATDIVDTWRVHAKTARRDVKGLLEAKLINAERIGRIFQYGLL
jgi:hypothetical protein